MPPAKRKVHLQGARQAAAQVKAARARQASERALEYFLEQQQAEGERAESCTTTAVADTVEKLIVLTEKVAMMDAKAAARRAAKATAAAAVAAAKAEAKQARELAKFQTVEVQRILNSLIKAVEVLGALDRPCTQPQCPVATTCHSELVMALNRSSFSQMDVAAACGLSPSQLSVWKTGRLGVDASVRIDEIVRAFFTQANDGTGAGAAASALAAQDAAAAGTASRNLKQFRRPVPPRAVDVRSDLWAGMPLLQAQLEEAYRVARERYERDKWEYEHVLYPAHRRAQKRRCDAGAAREGKQQRLGSTGSDSSDPSFSLPLASAATISSGAADSPKIKSDDLETTVRTLRAVAANLATFRSEAFAPLRDAMGLLMQEWLRLGIAGRLPSTPYTSDKT